MTAKSSKDKDAFTKRGGQGKNGALEDEAGATICIVITEKATLDPREAFVEVFGRKKSMSV